MAGHRKPYAPSLLTSGFICSCSAIAAFHGIDASWWWGLVGWALAVVGVFLSIAGAGEGGR